MNKKTKKRKEPGFSVSNFFYSILIKTFVMLIIFLVALIFVKQSSNNKKIIKNLVYKSNISFASIYNVYKKYVNFNIFSKIGEKSINVSKDAIDYKDAVKDNNGYVFNINTNYVSAIKSGILTRKKKSNKYGYLITIQSKDGLDITYGYISNIDVKLYDYVKKDEILGSTNKKVYLKFKKNGKYVSYEEYL